MIKTKDKIEIISKTLDSVKPKTKTKNYKTAFFDGKVSEHFKGKNVYIGDLDFKFADDTNVIIGEIKYVNSSHKFLGSRMTFLQAREYAAMTDVTDNLGRQQKTYLFEAHEVKEPYVAVVPFLKPTGEEKHPIEFLDIDNGRLVYVDKDNQFGRWIAGDRHVGTNIRNALKCV